MNNLAITGAFNVGKSTVYNGLKDKYKDDEQLYFADETASQVIKECGKRPTEMNTKELEAFQLEIFERSWRHEDAASEQGKVGILDASLIDIVAYSQNLVKDRIYNIMNNIVHSRAHTYKALYLPSKSRIKLEDNGIRHVTKDNAERMRQFQHTIANRILMLFKEHNIAHYTLNEVPIDKRIQIASRKIELMKGQDSDSEKKRIMR